MPSKTKGQTLAFETMSSVTWGVDLYVDGIPDIESRWETIVVDMRFPNIVFEGFCLDPYLTFMYLNIGININDIIKVNKLYILIS